MSGIQRKNLKLFLVTNLKKQKKLKISFSPKKDKPFHLRLNKRMKNKIKVKKILIRQKTFKLKRWRHLKMQNRDHNNPEGHHLKRDQCLDLQPDSSKCPLSNREKRHLDKRNRQRRDHLQLKERRKHRQLVSTRDKEGKALHNLRNQQEVRNLIKRYLRISMKKKSKKRKIL